MRRPVITLLAALPLLVSAQILTVEPGRLSAEKSFPAESPSVTLLGAVNAADLDYIATAATGIGTLDMSAVRIVEWKGRRVGANLFESPANVLPPYSLAGLKAKSLVLPDSLTAIGDGALLGASISRIVIPSSVRTVGSAAFADCENLESLSLPEHITAIEARTFENCRTLDNVSGLSRVDSIGERAFYGCTAIRQFDFASSLDYIGAEAFARSGLETADLSASTRLSVNSMAFAHDTDLQSVILPDAGALKGDGIFFDCTSLSHVTLPATDTIPTLTLKGVSTLSEIALPASVEHIGEGAFEGTSSLSTIDASALSSVPTLGDSVWAGVNAGNVDLLVPEESAELFRAAPQWQDFRIGGSWITTGTETTLSDSNTGPVKVMFDGMALLAESGTPIQSITIYSLQGLALRHTCGTDCFSAQVDSSRLPGAFFVVTVLTDSGAETFKLMR